METGFWRSSCGLEKDLINQKLELQHNVAILTTVDVEIEL